MSLRTTLLTTALASSMVLAACATPSTEQPFHTGMMPRGQAAPMDMAQMCARHEQMMSGRTPEQQRELMEAHMKAMHGDVDPEMVETHRQMMEQNCAST